MAATTCKCDGSGVFFVSTPDGSTGPDCPKGKWAMFCPQHLIENGQKNAISTRLSRISTIQEDGNDS